MEWVPVGGESIEFQCVDVRQSVERITTKLRGHGHSPVAHVLKIPIVDMA